jgi:hypothetical protein
MECFLQKYRPFVSGILSGFDRLVFQGHLSWLMRATGMLYVLRCRHIELKDFGAFAERTCQRVKEASMAEAKRNGRPVQYLKSRERKDTIAREIAARDKIESGLICVLSAVENCMSFELVKYPKTGRLWLRRTQRKCLHLYHYYLDEQMGLMHVRLQTWWPFDLQVYLNGREWLARTLEREGIAYRKSGNCFTQLEHLARAQELFDAQRQTDWRTRLNELARRAHPAFDEMFAGLFPKGEVEYYWSARQTEWASDVMFKDPGSLAALYPRLVQHALTTFDSPSVMRFLGQPVTAQGGVHGLFRGRLQTMFRRWPDCVRVRHELNGNALKMYNKEGTLLRVETTIGRAREFKVYRSREGDAGGEKAWLKLRQGIADLPRRAEVSQAANARYLDALAAVETEASLGELWRAPSRPVVWKGRRVRALRPTGEDAALLAAIGRGEYALNGFRNRDLRKLLFSPTADRREQRRQSSRITRQLRMLRAHGLIRRIQHAQRYQLTQKGRDLTAALSAATRANTRKLIQLAA